MDLNTQLLQQEKQENQNNDSLKINLFEKRQQYESYFQYIVSVLGYMVGFGSIWRFPYLVYKNGGGAFLIPYLFLLFTIAIPMFYLETALGQIYQVGTTKLFDLFHKKYKGIGILPIILVFNMSAYYCLLLGLAYYYLCESFRYPLPWDLQNNKVENGQQNEVWNPQYFYQDILHMSKGIEDIGSIVWPVFFFFVLSQVISFICVHRGIKVSGRVAMITATSPYILVSIMVIRGLQLEGSDEGLKYLFKPDMSKLFSLKVWCDAAVQVFFQMGTGQSVLVFLGSYKPRNQEIIKSSIVIPLMTALCGFLCAIGIFTFMGYVSQHTHVQINDIPLQGTDLAYVAYPGALTMLPLSNFWSILFFLTMILLGIDTHFGLLEAVSGALIEEIKQLRATNKWKQYLSGPIVHLLISIVVCAFAFIFARQGGFYYLEFVDYYTCNIPLILSVFLESFIVMWCVDFEAIEQNIFKNVGEHTPKIFILLIKYFVPFISGGLSIIALYEQILNITKNVWYITIIGWIICLIPIGTVNYFYFKYKDSNPPLITDLYCSETEMANIKY